MSQTLQTVVVYFHLTLFINLQFTIRDESFQMIADE